MTDGIAASLAAYVAGAGSQSLPGHVREAASLHLLDTVAAAVSGARLPAGGRGRALVERNPPGRDATVWASSLCSSVPLAGLANAMSAHADETDDSHAASRTHPGSSVVPATLAAAEAAGSSGEQVLRAVALGYDVCTRVPAALWPAAIEDGRDRVRSTHAAGGLFGAAMAVAGLRGLTPRQVRHVLAYATQQVAGIRSYFREPTHVEKAFVFAGMPVLHAMTAAEVVAAGWAGVDDPVSGSPGLLDLGDTPEPDRLVHGLGTEFAVVDTKFKKYPVASPVQSALDALVELLHQHRLARDDVDQVLAEVPSGRLATVKGRPIADVNIEFLLGVALEYRSVPFDAVHDTDRFDTWWRDGHRGPAIRVVADDGLPSSHAARVTITTREGRTLCREVAAIPGSAANPMSRDQVEAKARQLMVGPLGEQIVERVITGIRRLHELEDIRPLLALLATNHPEAS